MSFYYVNENGSIVDDKVVNIESAVDCKIQIFNNIIDFYGEESNRSEASLWNTYLLILYVRKRGSYTYGIESFS